MEERIDSLLGQMTLEEKAAFVGGSSMWYATPLPRLGIPRLKVSDGPIGVRGGNEGSGHSSACFPNGSALAATWNPELIEQVGVVHEEIGDIDEVAIGEAGGSFDDVTQLTDVAGPGARLKPAESWWCDWTRRRHDGDSRSECLSQQC